MKIERRGQLILSVDDWRLHAPPKSENQWKPGRSAHECACAWCGDGAPAVPEEIRALLDSHPDTQGTTLDTVLPEHEVRFDKLRGEPRNTDVAALGNAPVGRIAISIEAKADEPFGEYLGDILADAADRVAHGDRTGVATRIQGLLQLLPSRPPRAPKAGGLRYQLLTALAGAIAFAQTKGAAAILVVHEFATSQTRRELRDANALDLNLFVSRLTSGAHAGLADGQLIGPFLLKDTAVPLYLGKAVRWFPAVSPRLDQTDAAKPE